MCKILIRRKIDTAHNFANKPVFSACNGVQIRRRVSYKADTKEDGRTPRTPKRKFYRRQHEGRRVGKVATVGEYKGEGAGVEGGAQRGTPKTFGVA